MNKVKLRDIKHLRPPARFQVWQYCRLTFELTSEGFVYEVVANAIAPLRCHRHVFFCCWYSSRKKSDQSVESQKLAAAVCVRFCYRSHSHSHARLLSCRGHIKSVIGFALKPGRAASQKREKRNFRRLLAPEKQQWLLAAAWTFSLKSKTDCVIQVNSWD